MKILFLFLTGIFLLSLCSCKKKYTCTCTTTYTYRNTSNGYSTVVMPAAGAPYSEKMNLTQAKAACGHEQTAIQTDFTNGITGNGRYSLTTGEVITTNCAIKL